MIIDKEFNLVLVFGSVPTARGFWNFPILSPIDSLFCALILEFLKSSRLCSSRLISTDLHYFFVTRKIHKSWNITQLANIAPSFTARRLLTPPKSARTSSAMIENPLQKCIIQTNSTKILFKRDGFRA